MRCRFIRYPCGTGSPRSPFEESAAHDGEDKRDRQLPGLRAAAPGEDGEEEPRESAGGHGEADQAPAHFTYYAAYVAGIKLLLLKNKRAAEGEPPWTLFFCARPERKPQETAAEPVATAKQSYPAHRSSQPRRKEGPVVDPTLDDDVPWLG